MMQKTILLVEDDKEISKMVESHLQQEGFHVITVFDGVEATRAVTKEKVDLVLLDLMLPKMNGIDFLKKMRETSLLPVLIISAKGSDLDKALGLGFGADDYIAKPFSLIELTARVQAAIRRATQYVKAEDDTGPDVLHFQQLALDLNSFAASKQGRVIKLTSKEFQLLKLFMENPTRVFTKEQIYELIWEDAYYGDENVINVHIRRLREKIEDNPSDPRYICTIWGIGYKLGE